MQVCNDCRTDFVHEHKCAMTCENNEVMKHCVIQPTITDELKEKISSIINTTKYDFDKCIVMTPTHAQKDECVYKCQEILDTNEKEEEKEKEEDEKEEKKLKTKKDEITSNNIKNKEEKRHEKGEADLSSNDKMIKIIHKKNDKEVSFSTIHFFVFHICMFISSNVLELDDKFDKFEVNCKVDDPWEKMSRYIILHIDKIEDINNKNFHLRKKDFVLLICDEVQNIPSYMTLALLSIVNHFPHWRVKFTGDFLQTTLLNSLQENIYMIYVKYIKKGEKFICKDDKVYEEKINDLLGKIHSEYITPNEEEAFHKRCRNPEILDFINRFLEAINVFFRWNEYRINLYKGFNLENTEGKFYKKPSVNIYNKNEVLRMVDDVVKLINDLLISEKYKPEDILIISPIINNNHVIDKIQNRLGHDKTFLHISEQGQPIDLSQSEKKIRIMSIHGSQGTGRPVCIVLQLNHEYLVCHNTYKDQLKYDSLINVALTRSKDELHFFCYNKDYISDILQRITTNSSSLPPPPSDKKFIYNEINIDVDNTIQKDILEELSPEKSSVKNIDMSRHIGRFEIMSTLFSIKLYNQSKDTDIKEIHQMKVFFDQIKTYELKKVDCRKYCLDSIIIYCSKCRCKTYTYDINKVDNKDGIYTVSGVCSVCSSKKNTKQKFEEKKEICFIQYTNCSTNTDWTEKFMEKCQKVKTLITEKDGDSVEKYILEEKNEDIISCSFALTYMINYLNLLFRRKKTQYLTLNYSTCIETLKCIKDEEERLKVEDKDFFYIYVKHMYKNILGEIPSLKEKGWISNYEKRITVNIRDFCKNYPQSISPQEGKIVLYIMKPTVTKFNIIDIIKEMVFYGFIAVKYYNSRVEKLEDPRFVKINEKDIKVDFTIITLNGFCSVSWNDKLLPIFKRNKEPIINYALNHFCSDDKIRYLYTLYENSHFCTFTFYNSLEKEKSYDKYIYDNKLLECDECSADSDNEQNGSDDDEEELTYEKFKTIVKKNIKKRLRTFFRLKKNTK